MDLGLDGNSNSITVSNLTVSGVSTFSGVTASTLNVSGISTFSDDINVGSGATVIIDDKLRIYTGTGLKR